MSSKLIVALLATTAIAGLTHAPRAVAQTDQPTASAGNGLEEIVVTARRREERVQSVPIAITAFSQADIEKKQIHEIHDLAQNVPSLSIAASQSDSNGLYSGQLRLRGLPGTEIYFNDVPIGNADIQPGTGISHGLSEGFLFDLADIEIVKGPQGTLFGKNSVGGLISIKPKKPTDDYEGYLKVTLGNYSDKEVEGAVNIPIVQDKLLVRIAGQMQQRDGYTHDVSNGQDRDNKNFYAWRASVTLRPTDDIENNFVYDGYWQDTNGSGESVKYYNPKTAFATVGAFYNPKDPRTAIFNSDALKNIPVTLGVGPNVTGFFSAATFVPTLTAGIAAGGVSLYPGSGALFAQQQALGPRQYLGSSIQGIGKDYFYGLTDTFTWNIDDNLTLKNIAAARIFKQLATADFAPLTFPLLNIGVPGNQRQWSDNSVQYTEEIQLQGKSLNDKLTWVAGGYLEYDHPLGDTLLGSAALGNTPFGTVGYYHFNVQTRSEALFAHGTYDLGDYVEGLSITGGYRYTWDYASTGSRSTNIVDGVTRGATINGVFDPNAANNCGGTFAADNNCYQSVNAHYSSYGWNASIQEQLDPQTLIYVRAGNAYRPGAFNLNVPVEFSKVQPEHDTDVEIGVKADWDLWGMHARTNADIFHTDYKSIQVSQTVPIKKGNVVKENSINENAASATLEGAEFEATFLPYKGVEIAPHASYLHASYGQYPTAFGAISQGTNTPFNFTPKWQYGVTATYHLPLDESLGDIAIAATYSWYGHQYNTQLLGEFYPIQPSYENINLRVDWTDVLSYPVDLSFFMTNVQDNVHVIGATTLYTNLGFDSVSYNRPRMFGFSAKYRFGAPAGAEEAAAAYTPPPVVAPAPSVPKSYLVFFDFNKSDLTPQAVSIVGQAAANAGPAKVTQLTVTGHTDTVGSDAYNMRLSRRRAESVAAQLEKDGIPSSEISIVAKGKRDLLVPTADGVKEPQNRRVQIVYDGGPTS
jgi:iron complex outermembrane receptor protein